MILAHSWFIHALYGSWFGWLGVLGALVVDIVALFPFVRSFRGSMDPTFIGSMRHAFGTWWSWMGPAERHAFHFMHGLGAVLGVFVLEIALRMYLMHLFYPFWMVGYMPVFTLGYLTHVLTDILTHPGHLGRLIGEDSCGPWIGIQWWHSKFYWTEWAGAGLVVLVYWLWL